MGYEEHRQKARELIARCAVITLSDTRTAETDGSGKRIIELLTSQKHSVSEYHLIPDDAARLRELLTKLLANSNIDAILTNGGTGISARDQTISVIEGLLQTPLPGFGELFRMLSYQQIASGAMLSRAIAGVARGKAIFALPGSTAAVELALTSLILPELPHLLMELQK